MARTIIGTFLKRKTTDRPKPTTVMPGLSKGRRYDNGGKLKSQNKKKST